MSSAQGVSLAEAGTAKVRAVPPHGYRLPPMHGEPENSTASPTSPKQTMTRPLPPTSPPPTSHSASNTNFQQGASTQSYVTAGDPHDNSARQSGLPAAQRALSPPPRRALPTTPGQQGTSRPLSPPPLNPELAGGSRPTASSPQPSLDAISDFKPRKEDDSIIARRLGPVPTSMAPVPRSAGEERSSTPPLPESPMNAHLSGSIGSNGTPSESMSSPSLSKRGASSSVSKTLDIGPNDKPAKASSGLFGILSRPSNSRMTAAPGAITGGSVSEQGGTSSHQFSAPGSPMPGTGSGEHDKLRVHYKQLLELPADHFVPVLPDFKPNGHRDRVAFEVFTSEQSFNNFMRILIEVFKNPLLKAQKAGHVNIKEDDCQKVFGPIESVLAVSDILLAAFKERIMSWDSSTQLLGNIFIQYGDLLKVYATYARDQQPAKIAQSHCSSSKNYPVMLKLSQQFPACQSRDLQSLLIMPIQRIPRYELLLRDLIKVTEPTHPDLANLNTALAKVKSVAEQVDRSVEEYKQLEKLLAIQGSFSGSTVDLVKPGRRFLKEGALVKVCRRANKTRKFWLFNDILLYGIPILTGTNVISGEFSLRHLMLQDLPDLTEADADALHHAHASTGSSGSTNLTAPPQSTTSNASDSTKKVFQFMIQSRAKSFVVIATSQQEKADWMVAIMTAATEFQENAKSLGGNSKNQIVDVAPAWVPDSQAPNCKLCSAEFGLVTRRHHCRHCGLVVCDDCSKHRIVIPGLDKNAVRVCNNCVTKLGYGSYDPSARSQASGHASVRFPEASSTGPINLLANLNPPPGSPSPVQHPSGGYHEAHHDYDA